MGDASVDWKQRACDYFDTLQEFEAKCKEHQIAREVAEERSRDLYAQQQRAVEKENHKDRQIRDLLLEKASLAHDVEQLCQGVKVRSTFSPLPLATRFPAPTVCSSAVSWPASAGGFQLVEEGWPRGRGADRVHGAHANEER